VNKILGLASVVFLACILIALAVGLSGCGGDDEQTDDASLAGVTDPSAADTGTPSPQVANPTYGGTPPTNTGGTTPTGGTSTPSDPASGIAFEEVQLKSPVKTITIKKGNTILEFKRFKYEDWEGKVQLCEMPADETKVKRKKEAWLATFDIYRVEVEDKKKEAKKDVDTLSDFPFVSPRPSKQSQENQPGQSGNQNQLPTGQIPGAVPPGTPGQRPPGW